MKRLQQSVSRKNKSSANRKKALARLNACHGRIAAARRDFLHHKTTELVRVHALIAIEDLAVKGMTASAAATDREPGRNVKAKSGLNRTLLRHGWGMARSMLESKTAWRGAMLVAVPPDLHEPAVQRMWPYGRAEQEDAGAVRLRGLRTHRQR